MTVICAVDPGPTKSAFVSWDTTCPKIIEKGHVQNEEFLDWIGDTNKVPGDMLAIEQAVIYRKAAASLHDTIFFYAQLWTEWRRLRQTQITLVTRSTVLSKVLSKDRRKATRKRKNKEDGKIIKGIHQDTAVIQELTARYGGKGVMKNPGFFYGVSGDVWQAAALAVYVQDHILKEQQNDY